MARSFAKRRAQIREWKNVDVHAPRRSAHHEQSGASVFRQPLNLREVITEFPCTSPKALDDQQLAGRVRIALSRYQSARQHHVPRKDFRDAAKAILAQVEALRAQLATAGLPDGPNAGVMSRVDEITDRETTVVVRAELDDLSEALERVLADEPERGNLRDEPMRALVYELSEVYRSRTGKKPSREYDNSMKWHKENPDKRPLRERELDGNEFARFVFLIEKAYLIGLGTHLKKRDLSTKALSERDVNAVVTQFSFGSIRQTVVSIVDARRKENWR